MRMANFRSFTKADGGVAAIEMAFIVPFMLLMFFGLIDLTGLISFNRKITSVAASVGDLVGQHRTNIVKSNLTDYFKVVGMIMKPNSDTGVSVIVSVYRKASTTTVTKIWEVKNVSTATCPNTPAAATMLPLMGAGNDLVVTQTCMKYKPYVGSFLGTYIIGSPLVDLQQTITVRPRSSLTLTCTDC